MKQSKVNLLLGAIQVQLSNSFFYVGIINTMLLAVTAWRSWIYEIAQKYAPWFTFWHFIGAGVIGMILVMLFDYLVIYPSRAAFTNEQACKHDNPAMDKLNSIESMQVKIMAQLGITEE